MPGPVWGPRDPATNKKGTVSSSGLATKGLGYQRGKGSCPKPSWPWMQEEDVHGKGSVMGWNPGMQVLWDKWRRTQPWKWKENGEQFQSLCLLQSSGPLFFLCSTYRDVAACLWSLIWLSHWFQCEKGPCFNHRGATHYIFCMKETGRNCPWCHIS